MSKKSDNTIDWSLSTWEGSRLEKLKRWSKLPLERIIAAIEEMQDISDAFSQQDAPQSKRKK